MDNASKIRLLELRLTALEREELNLSLLETTMKLMMTHGKHTAAFQSARQLIAAARTAYNEELDARTTSGWFARKKAVSNLRSTKAALYGTHKMANVNLEAVRMAIDEFEAKIGYTREDGVLFFNTIVRRTGARGIPEAAVVPRTSQYDHGKVRLGRHIFLNTRAYPTLNEKDAEAFHLTILRCLRRIVQTTVGQQLLRDLDVAAGKAKVHNASVDAILEINLGTSNKDWCCQCLDSKAATAAGKPTIDTIPKRGGRQGDTRGNGTGSISYVRTFPEQTIQIGTSKTSTDNAWIPAHVALFHELTHAVRGMSGKQDHTYLSAKPGELGDTFAHAGTWYTAEEKFTVNAEKEYSEETGFNLKRLNYGQMAERIDH